MAKFGLSLGFMFSSGIQRQVVSLFFLHSIYTISLKRRKKKNSIKNLNNVLRLICKSHAKNEANWVRKNKEGLKFHKQSVEW